MPRYALSLTYTREEWQSLMKHPHSLVETLTAMINNLGGRAERMRWDHKKNTMGFTVNALDCESVGALVTTLITQTAVKGLKITALKKLKARFDSQDNVNPPATLCTIHGIFPAFAASS